jgi:hypothetical protein
MYPQPQPPPRKRHIFRWILTGVGAFIVLIIVISVAAAGGSHTTATPASPPATTGAPAAPAATQSPSPDPSMFGLAAGQPVTLSSQFGANGGTVTVTKVISTTSPADPSYGSGPANGQYILVQVTYTAAAGKNLEANALDWYAKTPSGQHYDYSSGNAMQALNSSQMLTAATINGGETTTGWISFDVPAGHGTIVYAPNFQGQPLASWAY